MTSLPWKARLRRKDKEFLALERGRDAEIADMKKKMDLLTSENRALRQGQLALDIQQADAELAPVLDSLETFILKVFGMEEMSDADQVRVNNWLDRLGILVQKGREKVRRAALDELVPEGEDFDVVAAYNKHKKN